VATYNRKTEHQIGLLTAFQLAYHTCGISMKPTLTVLLVFAVIVWMYRMKLDLALVLHVPSIKDPGP